MRLKETLEGRSVYRSMDMQAMPAGFGPRAVPDLRKWLTVRLADKRQQTREAGFYRAAWPGVKPSAL
jgi:hypothetical protein